MNGGAFHNIGKKGQKMPKPFKVFKLLLEDITRVLRPKIIKIPAEIQKLLPA